MGTTGNQVYYASNVAGSPWRTRGLPSEGATTAGCAVSLGAGAPVADAAVAVVAGSAVAGSAAVVVAGPVMEEAQGRQPEA